MITLSCSCIQSVSIVSLWLYCHRFGVNSHLVVVIATGYSVAIVTPFQYCILFCMQQDLKLELWFVNDLWSKILIDGSESSHQSTIRHTWGWTGPPTCPFTRRGNQARVCQCTGKQHLCQLSCKLLGYRFIMCFSLTYRSSLIPMIVVFLPLLMQWLYAMVNLQRVWTTTQRWWENTLLDVWKIKSSVIFQLAKEVLNRKKKIRSTQ